MTSVGLFCAARSDSAPGELRPSSPLVTTLSKMLCEQIWLFCSCGILSDLNVDTCSQNPCRVMKAQHDRQQGRWSSYRVAVKELNAMETYRKQNSLPTCLFLFRNNVDLKNNNTSYRNPFRIFLVREQLQYICFNWILIIAYDTIIKKHFRPRCPHLKERGPCSRHA